MMEKYISLRIIEQLEKNWSILTLKSHPKLYLSTGVPGHTRWRYHGISCIDVLRLIFKILISINYKNIKVYNGQF